MAAAAVPIGVICAPETTGATIIVWRDIKRSVRSGFN